MAKIIKMTSVITVLAAICFFLLYYFINIGLFLTAAITFGTAAYHFCIRLVIGMLFNIKMQNKADYTKKWYRGSSLEQKLYQKMNIKKWKNKMPTYNIDIFDASKHSWDEIAQAMCQSELVHETNIVFSFLPMIASIWLGAFSVFFVTSILSAVFDLMFVFMQRYNRSRILKMKERAKF